MSYRPKDWDDIKFHSCMTLTDGGGSYSDIYAVFEAGADAMLEALRDGGIHSEHCGDSGWLVFIPEEDDEVRI